MESFNVARTHKYALIHTQLGTFSSDECTSETAVQVRMLAALWEPPEDSLPDTPWEHFFKESPSQGLPLENASQDNVDTKVPFLCPPPNTQKPFLRAQEAKLLPERAIMRDCTGTLLNDYVKLKMAGTVTDEWSRLSPGWGSTGRVKAGRETSLLPFPTRQTPGEAVRRASQEAG